MNARRLPVAGASSDVLLGEPVWSSVAARTMRRRSTRRLKKQVFHDRLRPPLAERLVPAFIAEVVGCCPRRGCTWPRPSAPAVRRMIEGRHRLAGQLALAAAKGDRHRLGEQRLSGPGDGGL